MTREAVGSMQDSFTIRMLGQNIRLERWAWVELLDELRDDSPLAERISSLIGESREQDRTS